MLFTSVIQILFFASFLLAFLSLGVGHEKICSKKYLDKCTAPILTSRYARGEQGEFCNNARKSLSCLQDIVDLCLTADQQVLEDIARLTAAVKNICGLQGGGREGLACLHSKEFMTNETLKCTQKVLPDIFANRNTNESLEDKKCTAYKLFSECMEKSLKEKCGPAVARLFREGYRDAIHHQIKKHHHQRQKPHVVRKILLNSRCVEFFGRKRSKRSIRTRLPFVPDFDI